MELIRAAIRNIPGICGKQKREPGREYRKSKYCLSVGCEEGTLLYHTLTGEIVLVPAEPVTEEEKESLIERWYLVPEGFDERKFADDVKRIAEMLRPPHRNKTSFTILTTTDCNARCFYCYELGIRRFPMTEETALETAAYIHRVSGGKPVTLRWFGGEPLYNRKVIDIICNRLTDLGTEYESSMVSNGYYLDKETVNHALNRWHLRKVQITIDGTEALYNKTKAYIDADENPYRRVMDNIHQATEAGIKVTIRLNMDARNAQDLCLLAEDIAARFSDHTNLDVYIALLQEFAGKIHAHESAAAMEESYYAIRDKLKALGLLRKEPLADTLRLTRCMADEDASEVVLPDGRTGRCEHFSEEIITGDIRDDRRDRAVEEKWKAPLSVPECEECVLYPVCKKLQMCIWNRNACGELDRKIRISELTEQVLEVYNDSRKGD